MLNELENRLKGCLFLGSLGDAFGYTVEFIKIDEILRTFKGALEFSQTHKWMKPSETGEAQIVVSDDTQMTLFTAEAMIRTLNPCLKDEKTGFKWSDASLIENLREAYLDWFVTQIKNFGEQIEDAKAQSLRTFAEMFKRQAPGHTCLTACSNGALGFTKEAGPVNDSMGCGGVMRAAPIGFLPGRDEEELFRLGNVSASLTHGHAMGYLPAGSMAAMINCITQGQGIAESARSVRNLLTHVREAGPLIDAIDIALMFEDKKHMTYEAMEMVGEGWIGHECLAMGLAAAILDAPIDYRMTVAANHSGDSDSTASIAGQLIGAFEGHHTLCSRLENYESGIAKLDVRNPLELILKEMALNIS